jgi:hypothetical protein
MSEEQAAREAMGGNWFEETKRRAERVVLVAIGLAFLGGGLLVGLGVWGLYG